MCKVDGCVGKVTSRGWCAKHYSKWRKYGDPEGGQPRESDVRFWRLVDKRGPKQCWEWQGGTTPLGYGVITVHYKKWIASRYSWFLANGPIPEGAFICHHCDNPPCVNPAHLYVGDAKTNGQDASERGRIRTGMERLTIEQVREIRRLNSEGVNYSELGRRYGIHHTHARDICVGKRWGGRT